MPRMYVAGQQDCAWHGRRKLILMKLVLLLSDDAASYTGRVLGDLIRNASIQR